MCYITLVDRDRRPVPICGARRANFFYVRAVSISICVACYCQVGRRNHMQNDIPGDGSESQPESSQQKMSPRN